MSVFTFFPSFLALEGLAGRLTFLASVAVVVVVVAELLFVGRMLANNSEKPAKLEGSLVIASPAMTEPSAPLTSVVLTNRNPHRSGYGFGLLASESTH